MMNLRDEAEELAEKRGCVQENDCWEECVAAAMRELMRGY